MKKEVVPGVDRATLEERYQEHLRQATELSQDYSENHSKMNQSYRLERLQMIESHLRIAKIFGKEVENAYWVPPGKSGEQQEAA